MNVQYELADLLYLMQRLRDRQGGCPWDIEQTFESIAPHTLEEAYEVVDCIERGDYVHLQEELGDLLFQVIYHSQMASEQNRFAFPEVMDGLTAKLISRHPHVFPGGDLYDEPSVKTVDREWVSGSWEERKAQERAGKDEADASVLADIPVALPALSRLQKLKKRAGRAGMKTLGPEGTLDKIAQTVEALRHTLSTDKTLAEEQVGLLLSQCVELSGQVNVNAERAGRKAGRAFEQQFRALEDLLEARGVSLESLDLKSQQDYWPQVKQRLERNS